VMRRLRGQVSARDVVAESATGEGAALRYVRTTA